MYNSEDHYLRRTRIARAIGRKVVWMARRPLVYRTISPPPMAPVKPSGVSSWRILAAVIAGFICIPIVSFGVLYSFLVSQTHYTDPRQDTKVVHEEERPKVPIPKDVKQEVEKSTPDPVVYKDAATYIQEIEAASTLDAVQVSLNNFGQKYGLVFSYTGDPTATDFVTVGSPSEADLPQIKIFAQLFIQEWSKYPADWLVSSYYQGRPTIVLAKTVEAQLERGREQLSGLYTQQYKRHIYYSIEESVGFAEHDYAWGRGVIHHEAGHAVMMGMQNPLMQESQDVAWAAHNPVGFTYGAGINERQEYYHPSEGFVTQYARFSPDEDKAEVFSFIMTSQYRPLMNEWIKNDSLLVKKAALTKERVCSAWKTMCGTYYDNFVPSQ